MKEIRNDAKYETPIAMPLGMSAANAQQGCKPGDTDGYVCKPGKYFT